MLTVGRVPGRQISLAGYQPGLEECMSGEGSGCPWARVKVNLIPTHTYPSLPGSLCTVAPS